MTTTEKRIATGLIAGYPLLWGALKTEVPREVGAAALLGLFIATIAFCLYLARKYGKRYMTIPVLVIVGALLGGLSGLLVGTIYRQDVWLEAEKRIVQVPMYDKNPPEGFGAHPPVKEIAITPGGSLDLKDQYKISLEKVNGRAALTVQLATGEKRTFTVPDSGFKPYWVTMQVGDWQYHVAVDAAEMDVAKIRMFQRSFAKPANPQEPQTNGK